MARGADDEPRSISAPARRATRLRVLHGLIGRDVQIAWRRRHGRMLEQYLMWYPELGPKQALPAALVFAEYRARLSVGESASADEYRRRFPDQYAELIRLITAADQGDGTGTILDPRSNPPPDGRGGAGRDSTGTLLDPRSNPPPDGRGGGGRVSTGTVLDPRSNPPPPEGGGQGGVATTTDHAQSAPDTSVANSHTVAGAPKPDAKLLSPRPSSSQVLPISEGIKLFKCIGRGQFGEVFLGEAPGGVNVAVKRIFRSLDDESSQRELQSLQLIRELRHPYLLQTQAFWSLEDRLVIVMELAEGSLAEWDREVRRKTGAGIPVAELLPYFREAAEALDYLHSVHVLHRDVKPANLLRLKGHAKVADFGLARMMEAQQLAAATFCGTPLYMAPEVWKQKIHAQSDQYSLAATYVEMRTGRPLFPGPDYGEISRQHASVLPDLDALEEAERRVLLRALSKEPERRYPDCRSFADALTAAFAPPPAPAPAAPRAAVVGRSSPPWPLASWPYWSPFGLLASSPRSPPPSCRRRPHRPQRRGRCCLPAASRTGWNGKDAISSASCTPCQGRRRSCSC